MRTWYEIKNAAAGETDIWLYDEIGSWGVTAGEFVRELTMISSPTINLRINSPGGDVFDGIAIHTALSEHAAAVNVVVDGLAASAASFVAQAGDRISMSRSATMMIHEPYGMAMGDAATMAQMGATLDMLGDTIAGIYADRAGGEPAGWRALMRAETWYQAQAAVDAGLADDVVAAKPKAMIPARVFNLARFSNVPEWLAETPEPSPPSVDRPVLDHVHASLDGLMAAHGAICGQGDGCPLAAARMPAAAQTGGQQDPEAADILAAVERGLRQSIEEVFG